MHVFKIFQLKPSTYHQIVALGSKDSMLQLYLFFQRPNRSALQSETSSCSALSMRSPEKPSKAWALDEDSAVAASCCDASCDARFGESRLV